MNKSSRLLTVLNKIQCLEKLGNKNLQTTLTVLAILRFISKKEIPRSFKRH